MTALNVFVRPDAAYLVLDRAAFTRDGRISAIHDKYVLSDRHRMAVAFAGAAPEWLVARVKGALEGARTANEAGGALSSLVYACGPELRAEATRDRAVYGGSPVDAEDWDSTHIVVAYWRAGHGPGSSMWTIVDGMAAGPFAICEHVSPPPTNASAMPPQGGFKPYTHAVPLIESQRHALMGGFRAVGGGADLIAVKEAGVSACRIAEWNDAVGWPAMTGARVRVGVRRARLVVTGLSCAAIVHALAAGPRWGPPTAIAAMALAGLACLLVDHSRPMWRRLGDADKCAH